MAWTTPITVATNDILSAAQYNRYVRDNLLEMAPAKATSSGSIFTISAENEVTERKVSSDVVTTLGQTSSSTYADLSTFGPMVTANCNFAIVTISARMRNVSNDNRGVYASFSVSGATTQTALDRWRISGNGVKAGNPNRISATTIVPLNGGLNTFTMKYKVQATYGPAQFEQRELTVIPL